MVIEAVQRLAGLQHHIIGRVHHVVDAPNADFLQDRAQPVRAGADAYAAHHAGDIARAKLGVIDAQSDQVLDPELRPRQLELGDFKRIARHRADFPRDTDNTVEVRTVWRDFEIIDYVAARSAKEFGERLADFRVFAQNQQSVHLVGQAELLRRAHHALAEDAENPAFPDDERLLFTGLQW